MGSRPGIGLDRRLSDLRSPLKPTNQTASEGCALLSKVCRRRSTGHRADRTFTANSWHMTTTRGLDDMRPAYRAGITAAFYVGAFGGSRATAPSVRNGLLSLGISPALNRRALHGPIGLAIGSPLRRNCPVDDGGVVAIKNAVLAGERRIQLLTRPLAFRRVTTKPFPVAHLILAAGLGQRIAKPAHKAD